MSKEEFDLIHPHMPKSGKLLEIGSYPFDRTKDLINLKYDFTGLDLKHEKPEWNVVKCDIETEAFPFRDSTFDIVLMMQVMEHLGRNPINPLLEINRVLKPGGKLFLSTPNFYHLRNKFYMMFKGYQYEMFNFIKHVNNQDYTGHIRTYSKKELEMFFDYAKLKMIGHHYLWYKSEKYKLGGIITYCLPWTRDHHLCICEAMK